MISRRRLRKRWSLPCSHTVNTGKDCHSWLCFQEDTGDRETPSMFLYRSRSFWKKQPRSTLRSSSYTCGNVEGDGLHPSYQPRKHPPDWTIPLLHALDAYSAPRRFGAVCTLTEWNKFKTLITTKDLRENASQACLYL
jgi:hypothetical protein